MVTFIAMDKMRLLNHVVKKNNWP